jgi:chromosome segregation ATPase
MATAVERKQKDVITELSKRVRDLTQENKQTRQALHQMSQHAARQQRTQQLANRYERNFELCSEALEKAQTERAVYQRAYSHAREDLGRCVTKLTRCTQRIRILVQKNGAMADAINRAADIIMEREAELAQIKKAKIPSKALRRKKRRN